MRGLADVSEIGEETIGDIDHRVRNPGQERTETGARIGNPEAINQESTMRRLELGIGPAQEAETQERISDRPRNPDEIAGTGAAAPNFASLGNLPDRGQ